MTTTPSLSSALATRRAEPLQQRKTRNITPVWGAAVHCTGTGIVEAALKKNADPFEYVMAYYGRQDTEFFAHYVVGFDGTIGQVADEMADAQHVGLTPEQRTLFLSGEWESKLPPEYVAAWHRRWPTKRSPAHLFPGPSTNNAYVGFELLCWLPGCGGQPRGAGFMYTDAQHEAAARLVADIAARWRWPAGWSTAADGRVACHEDLNPLDRTSQGQGWDPGVVRWKPYFDWPWFADRLRQLEDAAAAPVA